MYFVLSTTTEFGKDWASFENINDAYRLVATMKESNRQPLAVHYGGIMVAESVSDSTELVETAVKSIGCVICAEKGFDHCDCANWETSNCD